MGAKVEASLVKELLCLTSSEAQAIFLQDAGLLNQQGLSQLLDQAMDLARSDPGKARQLANLCAGMAEQAAAPIIVPRATYIEAQTFAMNGDFNTSLDYIRAAHAGYVALGEELPALRTNVGLMHVLNELGRHQEVLELGRAILRRLDEVTQPDETKARQLATFVYHNQGICHRHMGQYQAALKAYAAAEAGYLESEMPQRLGDIRNNRGLILMHLGHISEALAAFEAAASAYADAGSTLLHAKSLINLSKAHFWLGNYKESLDVLAQSYRLLDSVDVPADKYSISLQRADVYLALNLYPEALDAYEQANEGFQKAGMIPYQAQAIWGLGATLAAQSQFEEAERMLSEAAALFAQAGNVPMVCSVMVEQAALQAARQEPAAALKTARQAFELVAGDDWPVQKLYAHLRLADLVLPDTAVAERHLLAAQRLLQKVELPLLRYRLYQRLGHLRRLQERDEEAQELLETAVGEIERLRGTIAQEAMRVSFLYDKIAVYEELLQLHLQRSTPPGDDAILQAFAVAEQAKSRVLVDLLTGVLETKQGQPADPDTADRLQTLQADLNAVYNELLAETDRWEEPTTRPELQARARELEQEISRLRLQSSTAAAGSDPFTTTLPLEFVQAQLPPDLALLAYHIIGEEIIAFVAQSGRIHVARGLSTVPTIHRLLQKLMVQWDRFRAGPAFVQQHMALLEKSAQRVLATLYQELVAPLIGHLQTAGRPLNAAQKVAIVPHGLLHQVPFHALFDGRQYLLENFELSYAPSATVLAICQQRAWRPLTDGLIAGVSDPLIPAVRAEVEAVAQYLPGAGICLDEQATLATLQAKATGRNVLHLACHGLFRADNPMFSALKLHDAWLTAADILPLDFTGALVTLSACESGRSQVMAGDEVIGLARAFLGAGAVTLAVSLWVVQDETTAQLMSDWYAHLQHKYQMSKAAALRAAQLALKATHSHPYYWAPFVLIGQR